MHFGLVAARAPLAELQRVVRATWPAHEPARSSSGFASFEEIGRWAENNHRFVSSQDWSPQNPGSEVYLFYQDGPWAVMIDNAYAHASDREALAKVSASLGRTIAIVIETAGGTAQFTCHEQGKLRREVSYYDGDLHRAGEPIPEEAGILPRAQFYMDEVDQLMAALGLTRYGDESLAPRVAAVELIDRTDYSRQRARGHLADRMVDLQQQTQSPRKPWWKPW